MENKTKLNITFINPNTEEQIVQAMADRLAYNLAENEEKVKFDIAIRVLIRILTKK